MVVECAPLMATMSETGLLTVLAFALIIALAALCLVFAFFSVPLSRKLESKEDQDAEILERLAELETRDDELRKVLRRHGILKSPHDRDSPTSEIKINNGGA